MHWEVFVIVGTSLFVTLIAIPMTLDKIPPNALYGFRTPRTLSDEKIWYPANRAAGRALALSGIISAVGAVIAGAVIDDANHAMFTAMGAFIVPLIVAVGYCFYALHRIGR